MKTIVLDQQLTTKNEKKRKNIQIFEKIFKVVEKNPKRQKRIVEIGFEPTTVRIIIVTCSHSYY